MRSNRPDTSPVAVLAMSGMIGVLALASIGADRPSVDFRTEVVAALGRGGCNQGACHGSPQGKGGFRLSLRGFDPELDYVTLTREALGRRTDIFDPSESLILKKATGRVPHQGGRRFQEDETAYRLLRNWIAQGCRPSPSVKRPVDLDVLPSWNRRPP